MRTMKGIMVFVVAMVLFAACEKSELSALVDDQAKSSAIMNGDLTPEFTTTIDDLTQTDRDGLLLMREEEKLAHDVYVFFFEKYGLKVFDNISKSETQHTSAVLALLNHFGIVDPAGSEPGVFSNPDVQQLYDQLIASGTIVEKALETGAYIEEYDIADLNKLLSETKNVDIVMVYTNLLRGSENHLRAFVRTLLRYEITYIPKIIAQENFDAILSGKNAQGNNGNGLRNGGGKYGKGNQGFGMGNLSQVDVDGDGICDISGDSIASHSGVGVRIDSNGDGVCDLTGDSIAQYKQERAPAFRKGKGPKK